MLKEISRLRKELNSSRVGFVATATDVQTAFKNAQDSVSPNHKSNMTTQLLILQNTMLKEIDKKLEEVLMNGKLYE